MRTATRRWVASRPGPSLPPHRAPPRFPRVHEAPHSHAHVTSETRERLLVTPILWAVVLGGAAFVSSFFGPMLVNPESNLGPIVGLVLGPLGVLVGFALGFLAGLLGLKVRTRNACLAVLAPVTLVGVLFLMIPEPSWTGALVEVEVTSCSEPAALVHDATERWEGYVERAEPWRIVRPDWRSSADSMLASCDGVILEVRVLRRWDLFRGRAPWNRGTVTAKPAVNSVRFETYFARYRGPSLEKYPVGARELYSETWEAANPWPPEALPTYLGLHVVSPATETQRAWIRE